SGFLSALFVNDTVCIMLTPLVAELALRSRRDPLPYLIALATSANVGSCATIIGNPQNMLIGAQSGIGFVRFFLSLAPASLGGLALCGLFIVLAHPKEFARRERLFHVAAPRPMTYRPLLYKSLAAVALLLLALLLGLDPAIASLSAAAILLVTRRVDTGKVFAEVDFSLLVFFAGLFVLTRAVEATAAFKWCVDRSLLLIAGGDGRPSLLPFSAMTAVFSNLVSNVPAVMLFRPLVPLFASQDRAWLILAMASTFAGNLSLLGSVANLIVAEGAKRSGIRLGFGAYLRLGLPITIASLSLGTAWLLLF
ncbi:MAG TPA: SLC13 family permease, partial [Rectinemataceae bacterium]|nr:SLC13 family permease [Rectinemataceae bacterium]